MESPVTPLAIVGMSCRFPGGLSSPSKLWEALSAGVSAIGDVPPDRWTAERYYSPIEEAKGKAYMRRGGFLTEDVSLFDAAFFGISPRDAENMDPQQRLLLEVVWEAFENAGIPLTNCGGRPVGVYVGGFMLDHMITQMAAANRSQINQNTAAGMMMTMLSNRVSHTFDLRGPSLSIDTACSSSLVAFNVACQDIWRGACEMAVVGGANVMLRPEYPMGMCKGQFLSRDGECKSFDERGDGYGRGEGAAAVLVKPLAAAEADGDHILATVLGTGTNQDGHTPGISMPSGDAQAALIREVIEKYAIDAGAVRYVECHGTGTAIGDPTEAGAIGATYGAANRGRRPVVLGSIKSNIGHLEACAGVAGVIKAVLTLQHGESSPLANLQTPNSKIDCAELNVRLSDAAVPLLEKDEPLLVAVNSFGYGGSNAHAVLGRVVTKQPHRNARSNPEHNHLANGSLNGHARRSPLMLPISGRHPQAVRDLAATYAQLLRSDAPLSELLSSATHRRAHLPHRAVAFGADRTALSEALDALSREEEHDRVVVGKQPYQGNRLPVFVFTGMGPQWWGMGQQLYRESSLYRDTVTEADQIFQEVAGYSILAEMLKDEASSQITATEFAQPANLLVQLGVLAMLTHAGVRPSAVVGHSVGEVASAYAAGALSLRDALTVSYHRSQLQAACRGTGGMLAVGCSQADAEALIADFPGVSLAALNGPTNLTLAGDVDQLAEIATQLQAQDVFHKQLDVEVPYHSPMMDPILGELHDALSEVRPSLPHTPLYSTVTGERVESIEYGADYWPRNVREPVRFRAAIQALIDAGHNVLLEVGPHPVLATSLRDCCREAGVEARHAFTLRRNQPELLYVERAVAAVHAEGCDIDWAVHNPRGEFFPLPNYPWQREHFWLENDRGKQDRIATIDHPMLGIQEAPGTQAWRNDFDHRPMLYLRDHVVDGMPILPAAAYIETLLELAELKFPKSGALVLRDLGIAAPMVIEVQRGLDCVTSYDPSTRSATIRSLDNGKLGDGQVHLTARVSGPERVEPAQVDLTLLREQCNQELSVEAHYDRLAQAGLQYGPAFQTIREITSNDDDAALARVEVEPQLADNLDQYVLHPTLLDACFQSLFALVRNSQQTFLPTGIGELCVYSRRCGGRLWCYSRRVRQSATQIECDLTLANDQGEVLATLRGMKLSAAGQRSLTDRFGDPVKQQILNYAWHYGEEIGEPRRLGHWVVVDRQAGLSDLIAARLTDYGAPVIGRVRFGDASDASDNCIRATTGDAATLASELTDLGEVAGVLLLNALASDIDSADPTGELAVAEAAAVLQALESMPEASRPRVYVATQAAFAAQPADAMVAPSQAAVNGFARVAFNELDGLRVSTIDLPAHIDEETIDDLVREALADDLHDEVALRQGVRLVSELLESDALSADQIEYCPLDDQHPLLVRPLRADIESVGAARVVETRLPEVAKDDVLLRIEATVVPTVLLTDASADLAEGPAIASVATVLSVGSNVSDLAAGTRVAGFLPPDLASHSVAPRAALRVVEVDQHASCAAIAATLGIALRVETARLALNLEAGAPIAIEHSTFGLAFADAAAESGLRPVLLVDNDEDAETETEYPCYSLCPTGIARAVEEQTAGGGFAALVAGMARWSQDFDQRLLRPGGKVVDADPTAGPVALAPHASALVRTDLASMLQDHQGATAALRRVCDGLADGSLSPAAHLDVSIYDLAWQKLPLANTGAVLVLTYDAGGRDLPVVKTPALAFRPDATYLVTGGFGGLGRKTVEWLVAHGARNLVLTGRTGADTPEKHAFLDQLTAAGATAVAHACDSADREQLQGLLAEIQSTLPPLRGVFHSGAVIHDQPIAELELPVLAQVMQSKALGAWNLHQLTRSLPLDHFVLYSSVANLVGNSRQGAYSAANGFLNGLAHHRVLQGLPATAVNWGAIADVGVVARDEKLEQFLRYTGLRGIKSDDGLAILHQAMARGVTQFGVTLITSWVDWARFETRGSKSPRFASLIAADTQGGDSSTRDALVAELLPLSALDRTEVMAALMVEIVAGVLKSDPESISFDAAINQLGVDSLMATEIQMQMDSQLGVSISVLQLIGDVTLRNLAANAVETLCGDASAKPAGATAGV